MARYTIHVPQDAGGRAAALERAILVCDSWNWGAFLFGPLWLFWHRHWIAGLLAGALYLAAIVTIGFLPITGGAASLAVVVLMILWGLEGASLRRFDLRQSGYAEEAALIGSDRDLVEQRFFAAATSRMTVPANAPAMAPSADTRRGPWGPAVIGSLPDSRPSP